MTHQGTKDTTPFHIYKDEVCKAAGLSAHRAEALMPPVKPVSFPRLDRVCVKRVRF